MEIDYSRRVIIFDGETESEKQVFAFTTIRNHYTGELIINAMFRIRNSDYTRMLEEEEEEEEEETEEEEEDEEEEDETEIERENHSINIDYDDDDEIGFPINEFVFTMIRNDYTGELFPNAAFRIRNYGGLRRFNTTHQHHDSSSSYSSGNGRCNSRPQCDFCFKFNNSQTTPFHLCPNDEVVWDFRTTAGPIAPPSKLRIN